MTDEGSLPAKDVYGSLLFDENGKGNLLHIFNPRSHRGWNGK